MSTYGTRLPTVNTSHNEYCSSTSLSTLYLFRQVSPAPMAIDRSRRVVFFLLAYSRSEKLGCFVMDQARNSCPANFIPLACLLQRFLNYRYPPASH